ncbi:unnamed protein product [Sphenostylis stenocarpa]|uniref:Flowering time control protein FCA n=1 Tax=Sphenostylis stenocarpa TaxID=92480 RepID=A0AA86SAZ5_9FABA|nr:unnamed protein product [Sphenostylis stenocarpa]
MTYHNTRRSPSGFRSGAAPHHRAFDSPPRRSPGRGGGFRPMGGEGPGEFGFNGHQPPPLAGQKRGFPVSGRGSGSPDRLEGGNFAKLFVGSVPRTATEDDIRPLFEEHGNVIEVALIKDRKTGQYQGATTCKPISCSLYSRWDLGGPKDPALAIVAAAMLEKSSCCFIKYSTAEEADQAIRALHNQHTLPGGVGPIQVRYADGERERLGAVEYKLFVGSLNKQATVKEVEEIFSKYGRVEDVYLMRDEKKQSRGCGFVKYSHRDMALAAISALDGIYTMRGCEQPLIVRFADPKRPRQGDSRFVLADRLKQAWNHGLLTFDLEIDLCYLLGLAFGGPGFGPRFDAPGSRLPSNIADPMGDRMPPPNAWRPIHPPNMGPSPNAALHGMGPPMLPRSGEMALPTNALFAAYCEKLSHLDHERTHHATPGSHESVSICKDFATSPLFPLLNKVLRDCNLLSHSQRPTTSVMLLCRGGPMTSLGGPIDGRFQVQSMPSMPQQNFNQPMPQIPPPNSQISPVQKPIQSSQELYPQAPVPYPQTSLRQHGQPNLPLSAGPLPSQQIHGLSGQFPTSQPQTQQSALSAAFPQTPLDTSMQSNTALTTNQQQVPPSVPQQPLQQSPSPLAQMLSQQTQTLQASFHSSQQAFSQLQQQLQMMQPSSQALTLQQNAEATKKQSQWAGTVAQTVASTHATVPATDVSSSKIVTSALPAINHNMAFAKCNWTEHISPEGFKYYYNSVTGESRWEKPEELTLYEQQQQRASVQQSQTQSQPSVLPPQQIPQFQQVQPQSHLQGQVLHQQQVQQPPLSSSFQAYGAGPQNVQGVPSAQELMWKNKPSGSHPFQLTYLSPPLMLTHTDTVEATAFILIPCDM